MKIEPILDVYQRERIETVQRKKQEQIIHSFSRTKGLKLYSYNMSTYEVEEVIIEHGNTICLRPFTLEPYDPERERTLFNPKCIYFESLNLKNAMTRVSKYRNGAIKDLCNLRKPTNNSIKFY